MLEALGKIACHIGNTPLINLEYAGARLFAKLEYVNFSGSSKDRAAHSIMYHAIRSGKIDADTTIVASSSGNMAIALASICKMLKIKFVPVIDPNINKDYEVFLRLISSSVVKVTERDHTGGFLLTRLDRVKKICDQTKNVFCADQYTDQNSYRGYYNLGKELMDCLPQVDYIFIAVSSGGAITGISRFVKKRVPGIRIIGVDIKGSVIFGQPPEKRFISGIGSSLVPPIIKNAIIDEVVCISQPDVIRGCHELLNEQVIFGGASSGAVYFAAKEYFVRSAHDLPPVAALIFPDRGVAYLDTIYNRQWGEMVIGQLETSQI